MALPVRALLDDPALQGRECPGLEAAAAHPAMLLRVHEPAGLEDAQVLHDSRKGHGEGRRELADRGRPAAQAFDHPPPAGIGQGVQGPVQIVIVKHELNYWRRARGVKGMRAPSGR